MNITRVVRDGVEFFTIDRTGESGMSEAGLARLCGVSRPAVTKFIRETGVTKNGKNYLDEPPSKYSRVQPKGLTPDERSYISHFHFISASVCADVIEHYAIDSRHKTEEALFAYRKFAKMGITAWIQEMTDWHGNAVPKNGFVIDFKTIDLLLSKKLDGTSYRVFLILQNAIRSRMTLTADEIMKRAEISRSAYTSAIGRLADANLLPEWITIKRRSHPERDVRDRLQSQLGGKVEAHTKFGLIDLLTETELIEIKIAHRWKDAIGHILAKSYKYPNHKKRLHLFGPEEPIMETIENACKPWDISVSFEKVDRPKLKHDVIRTEITSTQTTAQSALE
jgi:hypothetical protein